MWSVCKAEREIRAPITKVNNGIRVSLGWRTTFLACEHRSTASSRLLSEGQGISLDEHHLWLCWYSARRLIISNGLAADAVAVAASADSTIIPGAEATDGWPTDF